jgi:hypothetical protein
VVRFRIDRQLSIESFPETKNIPEKFPPEPVASKSVEEEDKEEDVDCSFSLIEYAVYDAEADTMVHHIRFSREDETLDDFGCFIYDTLKAGSYKICVLTHSIDEASLSGNILSFPRIGDTFYGNAEVDINVNTADTERGIQLKRIVGMIEFVALDAVPEKVTSFRLDVQGRYDEVNLSSGEIVEKTVPYVANHTFDDSERGEEVFNTHAFYSFVPQGNDGKLPGTVTLTANDKDSKKIHERKINNVPIVANKVTRYKGILYTPDSIDGFFDLTFENGGRWDNPIEPDWY